MKFPLHRLLFALVLGAASGATIAQTSATSSASSPVVPVAPSAGSERLQATSKEEWQRLHRVTKIIGTDVRNTRGEKIGDIKDLIIDRNGNVSHAVVSTGGFLGIGDRLHAVPWNLIQTTVGRDFRVLDIDKSRLKNAPNFDPKNWPNVIDERWGEDNNRHYQPAPANR